MQINQCPFHSSKGYILANFKKQSKTWETFRNGHFRPDLVHSWFGFFGVDFFFSPPLKFLLSRSSGECSVVMKHLPYNVFKAAKGIQTLIYMMQVLERDYLTQMLRKTVAQIPPNLWSNHLQSILNPLFLLTIRFLTVSHWIFWLRAIQYFACHETYSFLT